LINFSEKRIREGSPNIIVCHPKESAAITFINSTVVRLDLIHNIRSLVAVNIEAGTITSTESKDNLGSISIHGFIDKFAVSSTRGIESTRTYIDIAIVKLWHDIINVGALSLDDLKIR